MAQAPIAAGPLEASVRLADPARDITQDEVIELAEALQVRAILEEIKSVAKLHKSDEIPTPFQAAWQQCCEEIFFRATGCQWHMDEDDARFGHKSKPNAN